MDIRQSTDDSATSFYGMPLYQEESANQVNKFWLCPELNEKILLSQ